MTENRKSTLGTQITQGCRNLVKQYGLTPQGLASNLMQGIRASKTCAKELVRAIELDFPYEGGRNIDLARLAMEVKATERDCRMALKAVRRVEIL